MSHSSQRPIQTSRRQRQHSTVLTATPNKKVLKIKTEKRKVKARNEETEANKSRQTKVTQAQKKQKVWKKKIDFSSSKSAGDCSDLCDDDE